LPKIAYRAKDFRAASLLTIQQAEEILDEYTERGFVLTVRGLHYQFVSRGLSLNTPKVYRRLVSLMADARECGMIDWDHLQDSTRNLQRNSHWDDPQEIVGTCAEQFHVDRWAGQEFRPEVWIEKSALEGIIAPTCTELDVPYFACRGYGSHSELWAAGHKRMREWIRRSQTPIVFHLGDHDPSGIDMTRDLREKLWRYTRKRVRIERLALNMNQVEEYDPPPNFAKETDSRHGKYVEQFGEQSWELDALDPVVLATLIRDNVVAIRDDDLWDRAVAQEEFHKQCLAKAAKHWGSVVDHLDTIEDDEEDEDGEEM